MDWTITQPPVWAPDAVATARGWENPDTGELYVPIRGLNTKNGAPIVTRVSRIGTTTKYGRTTTISFRVKFNEVVTVTGSPRIPLTIGAASNLFVTYASGSGTSSLVFSYAVQNTDSGAISIASPIGLNSGTIKDSLLTAATLTFTPPNTTGMTVDTTLPTADDSEDITPAALVTGDNLDVIVNFSEAVEVTGTPQVVLDLDGTPANADYVSGSGTTALTFRYVVLEGDSVDAGDFDIPNTAGAADIVLNGGTIKDLAGNAAVTPNFTVPSNLSSVSLNSTAAPAITSVTFDSGNGPHSLAKASVLQVTANFDKEVIVTGSPRATLSIHGVGKNATYVSGSGSKALVFQYTVVSGDSATATQFTVSSPLTLNSGTIKDVFGTDAVLTFTPPTTTGVVVDNTAPTAPTVTFTEGSGTYNTGDVFHFVATYSDSSVVANGSPRIAFTINGVQRYAYYASVSSGALTFTYTVQASDAATSGQIVLTSPIDLNGGSIVDSALNAAVVTFTPPSMSGVVIDNVAPYITSVTGPSGGPNYKLGDTLTITVNFSEAVTVTGTPRILMDVNFVAHYATYASGSGTTALVFTATVTTADTAAVAGQFALVSPLQLNGGTIQDAAGNDLTPLTFTLPDTSAKRVDGAVPTAPTVVISGDTSNAFVTGDVLTLTATFNEIVVVTNTPRIAVVIGSNTRQANYASGTGTTALVFSYTIVSGDAATAGNISVTSPISLNTTGTIKDVVGNAATLTFSAPTGIALKTAN